MDGDQVGVSEVVLGGAQLSGPHPQLGAERSGQLVVGPEWIGFGSPGSRPQVKVLQTSSVDRVVIGHRMVTSTGWGSVLSNLFEVLTAGPGSAGGPSVGRDTTKMRSAVELAVRTSDGAEAHYLLDKGEANEVRAAIAPVLRAAGIRLRMAKSES